MATSTFLIATTNTSNLNSYASGSFTPDANGLLVVFVVASGTVDSGPTLTDSLALTTFTLVTSALKNSSADKMYCFVANQLVAASARTVTFGCPNDAATGAIISVFSITGLSKAGLSAIRQSAVQANQALGGTPAPTFGLACLTGNPVLGCIGNSTSPAATMTPPTSWTESAGADTGYGTPTTGSEVVQRDSGFTGTTVTWGSTSSTAFGSIIVELDTSSFPAGEEDAVDPKLLKFTPFDPEITVYQ